MVKRPKKSGQKQKEQDEIKSITYHLNRAFIEVNETNFFGRGESDFKKIFGVALIISSFISFIDLRTIH